MDPPAIIYIYVEIRSPVDDLKPQNVHRHGCGCDTEAPAGSIMKRSPRPFTCYGSPHEACCLRVFQSVLHFALRCHSELPMPPLSKPLQLARAVFALAPFSSCIFFSSRQPAYCSALTGSRSSSPLSQKRNQSTDPPCDAIRTAELVQNMLLGIQHHQVP